MGAVRVAHLQVYISGTPSCLSVFNYIRYMKLLQLEREAWLGSKVHGMSPLSKACLVTLSMMKV